MKKGLWSGAPKDRRHWILCAAAASGLGVVGAQATYAASTNGTRSATSGNWSTAGGWSGSTIASGVGAVATLPDLGNNTLSVTVDSPFTIGTMAIDAHNAGHSWTILAGSTLTFDVTSGNASITNTTSTTVFQAAIALNDSLDINVSSGSMDIQSVISGTGTSGLNLLGGSATLSGTGSNTYTGLTSISTGSLNLSKTSAIAIGSGGLFVTGGTVTYASSNQVHDGANVSISSGTLNFAGFNDTINSLTATAGTISNVGTVTLASTSTALSMRGVSIGGSIVLSGASGGSIVFDATGNPATGANLTNIALGSVNRTFDIGNSTGTTTDLTVSGVISATGNIGLSKSNGTGTLQFSGASSNTYAGVTTVSAGTLLLNKSSATIAIAGDGVTGTDDLVIASGGTVQYASTAGTDQIANGANVNVSGGTLDLNGKSDTINNLAVSTGTISTGAGTLTLTNLSFAGGTFSGTISAGGNISATNTTGTATLGASLTLSTGNHSVDVASGGTADITAAISGTSVSLAKTGSGTLILSNSNSLTAGVSINGGTLQLGHSGALGSSGTISFGGGTLKYTASNNTDYSARFSTVASQLYKIDTNGQSVTLATALTSSGGSLTKMGSGTLTLGGANTYGGDTKIDSGTLKLGANDRISNSSRVVLNGGTLASNGFSEIAATLQLSDNSTIDMAGGNSVLQFDESFGQTWAAGKTLTILNWDNNLQGTGNDRIYIGTAFNGVTGTQLNQIQFVDPVGMAPGTYGGIMMSDGQVVVPEPASLSFLALGGAGLLLRRRRRKG